MQAAMNNQGPVRARGIRTRREFVAGLLMVSLSGWWAAVRGKAPSTGRPAGGQLRTWPATSSPGALAGTAPAAIASSTAIMVRYLWTVQPHPRKYLPTLFAGHSTPAGGIAVAK